MNGPQTPSRAVSVTKIGYLARDYARALDWCRHTIEMEPCYPPARRLLAAVLVTSGRPGEAVEELKRSAGPLDQVSHLALAHALVVGGDDQAARQVVDRVLRTGAYVPAFHQALVHAGARDLDAAFASLSAACDERDPALVTIATEPRFDSLRSDPRYAAFVRRVGLGEP